MDQVDQAAHRCRLPLSRPVLQVRSNDGHTIVE